MPGNPLPEPTKNLKNSNFTYSPEDGWGDPPVTAAPKTVFDASTGANLVGTIGYQKWSSTIERNYNTDIPHLPGEKGILVKYPAKNAFQNNNGNEFNFELLVHRAHIFEYMKIAQPINFNMPREAQLKPEFIADVQGWEPGDQLEAGSIGSGITGEVHLIDYDESNGEDPVIIKDFYGHPELKWGSNDTVYNLTKGTSAKMVAGGWNQNNSKFMHLWVSDEPLDEGRGYENGSYALGIDPNFDTDTPDFSGSGWAKIDGMVADFSLPTQNTSGSQAYNELGTGQPVLFDVADNGCVVEIVVERKRSSGWNSSEGRANEDGVFALWKRVSRPGSPYEQWTQVHRNESRRLYSSYYENKWTHGYLFGNKNGGYREDTDFYLMGYQLWFEKPTFLTDAGV